MQIMDNYMKDRKKMKKLSRGLHLINKDLNIKINLIDFEDDKKPTKDIVIINGGLTTGLDEVSCTQLFIEAGFNSFENVIMVPGKQYCFVSFTDSSAAIRAVNLMCGNSFIPGTFKILYMGLINLVPDIEGNVKYMKPSGLEIIEEFILKEDEEMLKKIICWDQIPQNTSEGSNLKHRQVRHFGYEFKYGSNSVDLAQPLECKIPVELYSICQKLIEKGLMMEFPDQMTVNRYMPGQGIPPHVDTHKSFTGEIVSLSILGGITMDFYCNSDSTNEHYAVYLPPRSLCVMTGQSRYLWMHGISARKTDVFPDQNTGRWSLKYRTERISFTFRKIKQDGPCRCLYPKMCDSQLFKKENLEKSKSSLKCEFLSASELEKEHVHKVYEEIADHFSCTRHKPWPNVLKFIETMPIGSLLLDVGCGNGKYLGYNKTINEVGSDTSFKLLNICKERKFEVALSNCLNLPFRNETFDFATCIAVIHHLATQVRRIDALKEIIRVLRIGGQLLVYVWAMEQKREKMSTYLKQKRSNRSKIKRSNIENLSNVKVENIANVENLSNVKVENLSNANVENLSNVKEENIVNLEVVNVAQSFDCDKILPEGLQTCDANTQSINTYTPERKFLHEENGQATTSNTKYSEIHTSDTKNSENLTSDTKYSENLQDFNCDSLLIHENRTEFVDQDLFVPWKIKPQKQLEAKVPPTFHRFYHVFKEFELENLFKSFHNVKIINSYYDEGNWCILVAKTKS